MSTQGSLRLATLGFEKNAVGVQNMGLCISMSSHGARRLATLGFEKDAVGVQTIETRKTFFALYF